MRLTKLFSILVFSAAVFISGCRISPVYNVDSAAIPDTGKYTLKQIKDAITKASFSQGWIMKADKPGHLIGTLNLRNHVAVVDIKYTATTYSITYKDSVELKYDGTNIHRNYNNWIKNLDNKIKLHLSML